MTEEEASLNDIQSKYGIPQDFAAYLGYINIAWAYVETLLGDFLRWLVEGNDFFVLIPNSVSSSTITDWIRTLSALRFTDDETQKRISSLLSDIDELRAERNELIHGLWSAGPVEGAVKVRTVRLDRREMIKYRVLTLKDLQVIIVPMDAAGQELIRLGVQLGFHPDVGGSR